MAGVIDIVMLGIYFEVSWLLATLVICILFGILKIWTDPFRKIPGPRGWPILGNTLEFTSSTDQHALLLKWSKQYGRVFKYYVLFGGYRIHVTDPHIAKHVLVTNYKNYRRQDVLKKLLPGLGNGLITANGYAHAIQRKQLNPFFTFAKVQRFFPIFVSKTNELIKQWKRDAQDAVCHALESDILVGLTNLSLDVIGLCAFGYEFNCILYGQTEESIATDTVLKGNFDLQKRSLESVFPPLKFLRTKVEKEFHQAEKCLENLIQKIIKQKKSDGVIQNGEYSCDNNLLSIFLSMNNEHGNHLSSKEIYHQVFTFLVSGHETISLTGTWALYLLAKHPEIQSELRKEIEEVIGNREISWADLDKLKLLENCIKESLRLYPIALTTDRTSIGPDKLGPYWIPKGAHVMIGNGTLHRDEKFWIDADVFRPDRFNNIGGEDSKLLPYYFLPFSRGPRMCIGYRFAMAGLKVALAKLVSNFVFTFGDEEKQFQNIPEFGSISALTLKPFPVLSLQIKLVNSEIVSSEVDRFSR